MLSSQEDLPETLIDPVSFIQPRRRIDVAVSSRSAHAHVLGRDVQFRIAQRAYE
ncbi:MAG: hypothetical protein R3B83_05820 [Nitrospirales bacterium]|nr:hypothetical protein [Nitrospirales bacterium]